jgi:protein SCO1/2
MHDVPPAPPRRSLYRWPIRLLALGLLAAALFRFFSGSGPAPRSDLPRVNIVPPFSLAERGGGTITNKDLDGKVWVADFVYTTCPGPCPLITSAMARLQAKILPDPNVQLVSLSVDPQTDTPAVLAAYADHYHADPHRWWFLTGPEKQIYALIKDGFYQAVVDNRGQPPQDGQFTVTHSTQMALVDANGVVRGFYEALDAGEQAQLLRDIKILENEK